MEPCTFIQMGSMTFKGGGGRGGFGKNLFFAFDHLSINFKICLYTFGFGHFQGVHDLYFVEGGFHDLEGALVEAGGGQ